METVLKKRQNLSEALSPSSELNQEKALGNRIAHERTLHFSLNCKDTISLEVGRRYPCFVSGVAHPILSICFCAERSTAPLSLIQITPPLGVVPVFIPQLAISSCIRTIVDT